MQNWNLLRINNLYKYSYSNRDMNILKEILPPVVKRLTKDLHNMFKQSLRNKFGAYLNIIYICRNAMLVIRLITKHLNWKQKGEIDLIWLIGFIYWTTMVLMDFFFSKVNTYEFLEMIDKHTTLVSTHACRDMPEYEIWSMFSLHWLCETHGLVC